MHIVADDLGWAELGYHRAANDTDARTPRIDAIVAHEALRLERFCACSNSRVSSFISAEPVDRSCADVHKICSPTRCALQVGRSPVYVNVQNVVPEVHNPDDPIGGYQGIPVNMTGMAEHMRSAGYSTHFVGKWDAVHRISTLCIADSIEAACLAGHGDTSAFPARARLLRANQYIPRGDCKPMHPHKPMHPQERSQPHKYKRAHACA